MTRSVIEKFTGGYRFLSNFYPSSIYFDGLRFPTVEHAFQAAKTFDENLRQCIATASSPTQAKKLGRGLRLRSDWESVKVGVMKRCVELKFRSHFELSEMLLATGDAVLIEGNTWNDTVWGVCGGHGQNHLGKILMQVRTILADELTQALLLKTQPQT